ncbi:MAG: choice-of-anchor J domain-containing protein, partial [Bacteroidaceae bacterium]|nr:choice-of-anchor J domain-containing protein [Bacteroidaceae bacterium]
MNKIRYAFSLLILSLCAILQTAFAQEKLLETTFASSEEFNRWQVIDANNDDVTWRYNPTSSRGHAGYSYHYANGADDWLISPKITVDEATQLMVKYKYYGSFYSEKLEVYFGHSPEPAAMKLMGTYDHLKDQSYTSCFFAEVAKGQDFYIAFRAASLSNKQHLFIASVEVQSMGF